MQEERPLEVLLSSSQPIDLVGSPTNVLVTGHAVTGRDAGWAVPIVLRIASTVGVRGIAGQLSSDMTLDAEVLRTAADLGGYDQGELSGVSLAGGRLAYLASDAASAMPLDVDSAWLDDTLLARRGAPLAALGATWRGFSQVEAATDGSVIVVGKVEDAATQGLLDVVVRWPGEDVLYVEGQSVSGLGTPGGRLTTRVHTSPNGSQWTAPIDSASGGALLLNGAVLEFDGGGRAITGTSIPPGTGVPGGSVWGTFSNAPVNDAGDVAFVEALFSSQESHLATLRNRRVVAVPVLASGTPLVGMDRDGVLLRYDFATSSPFVEGATLLPPGFQIDVDRDGAADTGWSRAAGLPLLRGPNADGALVFESYLIDPSGMLTTAVLLAPSLRIDQSVCEGVPHSKGYPARLAASGDTAADSKDLVLNVYDLPRISFGFMLMSKTSGLVVQPGGSQGTLCLGGSIGRLNRQVFSTFLTTIATVRVDTEAVPQPMANAAIVAGETWYAQAWFRDTVPGTGPTSNFSSAIAVTFD